MSLNLRILQVDVPVAALDAATAFWAVALNAAPVPTGGFMHLHDAHAALEVHVQPIEAGPARYHLDLEVAPAGAGEPGSDRGTEVARLVGLGAGEGRSSDAGYTVLHDPAGLPLCVIDPASAPRTPLGVRRADRGYLDGIVLDVPAPGLDAEVAFWASALATRGSESPRGGVLLTDARGPGGPVRFTVRRTEGPARAGIQLSAPDVATDVARLEGLGARHVATSGDEVTLADPAGNLLCVVPR
jgi:hypothetical protein